MASCCVHHHNCCAVLWSRVVTAEFVYSLLTLQISRVTLGATCCMQLVCTMLCSGRQASTSTSTSQTSSGGYVWTSCPPF